MLPETEVHSIATWDVHAELDGMMHAHAVWFLVLD